MIRTAWIYGTLICLFSIGCAVKSNVILPYQADKNMMINYSISAKGLVDVPGEVLETMRGQIKAGLSDRKLLATKDNDNFYKANIIITEYQMRPDAARLLLGALAGCDTIKSNVSVVDSSTGKTIGESVFDSNVCGGWGVSAQVIEAHSQKIVDYLSGK